MRKNYLEDLTQNDYNFVNFFLKNAGSKNHNLGLKYHQNASKST